MFTLNTVCVEKVIAEDLKWQCLYTSYPMAELSSSAVPSASNTTSSLGLRSPVKVADVPIKNKSSIKR